MKKKIVGISLIVIIVLSLGIATVASAQESDGTFSGFGSHGSRGFEGDNPIHDLAIAEFAKAFDITVETLEARLDAGERMLDIAAEYGYEGEDFTALMDSIHDAVTQEALAQGLITQEQAELYANRQGFGGPGFKGQHGKMGGPRSEGSKEDNPLHDYMSAAMAEAFGISVEELDAAHEAGTPLHEVLGLEIEEFRTLMETVKESAIKKAQEDGVIIDKEYRNGPCQAESGGQFNGGQPGRMNHQPGNGMFGIRPGG